MVINVNGETPFKCAKSNFAIGPTTNGYTLNYSVDKETWTAYDKATPANENCIVNEAVQYMWFKLAGNTDKEVKIII